MGGVLSQPVSQKHLGVWVSGISGWRRSEDALRQRSSLCHKCLPQVEASHVSLDAHDRRRTLPQLGHRHLYITFTEFWTMNKG